MSSALAHIDSARALMALTQGNIWHCGRCDQHWLGYTESRGYYIDPRSRRLDPARVMDAPLPRTAAE